jgi:hypothetical protein
MFAFQIHSTVLQEFNHKFLSLFESLASEVEGHIKTSRVSFESILSDVGSVLMPRWRVLVRAQRALDNKERMAQMARFDKIMQRRLQLLGIKTSYSQTNLALSFDNQVFEPLLNKPEVDDFDPEQQLPRLIFEIRDLSYCEFPPFLLPVC